MAIFKNLTAALLSVLIPVACAAQGTTQASGARGPVLEFAQPKMQAALGVTYDEALHNLLMTNTVPYGTGKVGRRFDQTGLLAQTPGMFIRAGGGYDQPWTRDASINSWSAASLLEPAVARNTLWAVVKRRHGKLIVQQDNQWWDQTIWVVAAWHHYLVTGDRAFLTDAYQTAEDTLQREKKKHFNNKRQLFEGPAFLNDGIAGYPAPPADASESRGSFVLKYPGAKKMMVLSTNCIYVGAYRRAALMAQELGRPAAESGAFNAEADALAEGIRKQFWIADKGRFGYLIHADTGKLEDSQEGSGLAFSILFGVATPEQAAAEVKAAHVEPYGMVDVWPAFTRYDAEHPGRHNVSVWPPIEAFWAQAAAVQGDTAAFTHEVENLAHLVAASGGDFSEIYNAASGKPDGGWQVGHDWVSQPAQTWSATGYLRMIYAGLFGMRFGVDGLRFEPTLPGGWGEVTLAGVRYRGAVLTVRLKGAGQVVKSVTLDGVEQKSAMIPVTLTGEHVVNLELQ